MGDHYPVRSHRFHFTTAYTAVTTNQKAPDSTILAGPDAVAQRWYAQMPTPLVAKGACLVRVLEATLTGTPGKAAAANKYDRMHISTNMGLGGFTTNASSAQNMSYGSKLVGLDLSVGWDYTADSDDPQTVYARELPGEFFYISGVPDSLEVWIEGARCGADIVDGFQPITIPGDSDDPAQEATKTGALVDILLEFKFIEDFGQTLEK